MISKLKKTNFSILPYIPSIIIVIIVYISGGTSTMFVNFINIPIIIASSKSNKIEGLIHAGICGLMVGPFMPLFVSLNIKQKPINWIIRLIYFLVVSLIVSIYAEYFKRQSDKNTIIEKEISESNIATIYALVKLAESRDDDTGYPQGLSKTNIPLSARIMALIDVYDSLRSKRVYKDAYTHKESLEIIKEGRGRHFDPEIVDIFIENEKEFRDIFERISHDATLNN